MDKNFVLGFIFCMVADVFFSIANYFVQKALALRKERSANK